MEALVERGELVPRSLVAGRELGEVLEDLSEYPLSIEAKEGGEVGIPLVVGVLKRQGRQGVRALAKR